ncbi:uncharacterized protein [Rutidosis leptorrhynchoides]|uniref:uncharacterized protein n=1 Tax=Rutidosis leptorrhynchoides TaxID=125765 RepID=UPI003A991F57
MAILDKLTAETGQITLTKVPDSWCWGLSIDGVFNVNQTRKHIDAVVLPNTCIPTIWCKLVPLKINVFVCRMALNRLPSRVNLSSRGIEIQDIGCALCDWNVETIDHVLFSCQVASDMWRKLAGDK